MPRQRGSRRGSVPSVPWVRPLSNRHESQMPFEQLSSGMLKVLRKLSTPEKIQRYLDDLPYNKERDGETCRSPRLVIEYNTAHCFEGALFAAAALRMNGKP